MALLGYQEVGTGEGWAEGIRQLWKGCPVCFALFVLELQILLQVLHHGRILPAVSRGMSCHIWSEHCTAQGQAKPVGVLSALCHSAGQQISSNSLYKVLNHQITWFTGGIEQDKYRERGWSCYILIREKRCNTAVFVSSFQASYCRFCSAARCAGRDGGCNHCCLCPANKSTQHNG